MSGGFLDLFSNIGNPASSPAVSSASGHQGGVGGINIGGLTIGRSSEAFNTAIVLVAVLIVAAVLRK